MLLNITSVRERDTSMGLPHPSNNVETTNSNNNYYQPLAQSSLDHQSLFKNARPRSHFKPYLKPRLTKRQQRFQRYNGTSDKENANNNNNDKDDYRNNNENNKNNNNNNNSHHRWVQDDEQRQSYNRTRRQQRAVAWRMSQARRS